MAKNTRLLSKHIEVSDSLEAANQWFIEQKLSDGLPIVPPTEERVAQMIEATTRDPQELIGNIPPRWGAATVEKIAINAVMAGCLPEYMPVLLAAVEAMVEPEFNLFGIQATTGFVGPSVIVSGPVAQELNINSEAGCLGPGWRANSTIGRAIRLIMITLGGGIPGEIDRATFGWPGKFSLCFAENDDKNPWEPLRADRGFSSDDNTVTVAGANALIPLGAGYGSNGVEALTHIARLLIGCRAGGHLSLGGFGGGMPLILISPDAATVISRDFKSKREIQQFLYDKVLVHHTDDLGEGYLSSRAVTDLVKQSPNVTPDGMIRMADSPEDIVIVVCGGAGGFSVLLPMWTGRNTHITTKAIRR